MHYTLCHEALPVFSYCTVHRKMTPSPTPNHPLDTPHTYKWFSVPFLNYFLVRGEEGVVVAVMCVEMYYKWKGIRVFVEQLVPLVA